MGFDLGWPYYGADYYNVAPYYYGSPYPDTGYIGNGDGYHGDPGGYSGGDSPSYGSRGDYSDGGGPNNQPQSGGVAVRMVVRPLDATIYMDGRFWGSGHDASTLRLPEGRHRVEVVRPGFRTYTQDFDVNADRPGQLSITLERR
ncbi:MAG TPA: PEGA domain-containing protein [Vicinamibacteria bacterium]|nr:PEGA domain-containing protein [Vicinamibacteria bacterium]